jgi:hypothetical protein
MQDWLIVVWKPPSLCAPVNPIIAMPAIIHSLSSLLSSSSPPQPLRVLVLVKVIVLIIVIVVVLVIILVVVISIVIVIVIFIVWLVVVLCWGS